MAVDRFLLMERLMALEAAAAAAGELLADADEELLQLVAGAFAPGMPKGHRRATWDAYWLAWLRNCSERLQACASQASTDETHANKPIGPASWPQPFSDDVVGLAVSDARSPDSSVDETHLRPETGLQNGSSRRCSASSEAAEDALWAWVLGSVQPTAPEPALTSTDR